MGRLWYKAVGVCFLIILIFAIGCGSKLDKEMADAEAALQAAKAAGAEGLPEYKAAEDLIAKAKEMMAEGNTAAARSMLEEARFKAIEAEGKAKNQAYAKTANTANEESLQSLNPAGSQYGLADVFFDFDQSAVRIDAKPVLDQDASIIKNGGNKFQVVVIEGYCDTRGTEEYNLALGQRRAESVANYLVGLGVPPSKVQAISKGETEQFASGTTEYDYQQNRRAHFVPAVASPSF